MSLIHRLSNLENRLQSIPTRLGVPRNLHRVYLGRVITTGFVQTIDYSEEVRNPVIEPLSLNLKAYLSERGVETHTEDVILSIARSALSIERIKGGSIRLIRVIFRYEDASGMSEERTLEYAPGYIDERDPVLLKVLLQTLTDERG